MMTPVEQLRAAAKVLRETASNATPGPWSLLSYQIVGLYDEAADSVTDVAFTYWSEQNARWVRLASPALAEPLAAWLEREARNEEYSLAEFGHRTIQRDTLAVARAINGGTR